MGWCRVRRRPRSPDDRLASGALAGLVPARPRVGAAGGPAHFGRHASHVHMLSILMPVYNERERVERAIAEVLDTPLPTEFELIVVDDGSTDGTREILRGGSWDGRVRLFEHPENRGKGAAIQTALGHAEGEYAAIFDADL